MGRRRTVNGYRGVSAERNRMMCKGWMNPLIPESTRIKIAYDEITRLRAELAKVTWQRNEAQAGLAASRAELAHYVNRFGLWGAPLPRASLSTIHTLADQPGLDGESPA